MKPNNAPQQKYMLPLRAVTIIIAAVVVFALLPGQFFYQPGKIAGTGSAAVTGSLQDTRRSVFVGGAVVNEGYYTITPQNTYGDIFSAAGLLQNSYTLAYNTDKYVDFAADSIIIGFWQHQSAERAVNIAGIVEIAPLVAVGIDQTIARIIIGAEIAQKDDLKDILGEDVYLSVYYKLYYKKV